MTRATVTCLSLLALICSAPGCTASGLSEHLESIREEQRDDEAERAGRRALEELDRSLQHTRP